MSLCPCRISIGPEGTGTHALSLEFLARVGVIDRRSEPLALTPQRAAEKLLRGEIDAVIMLGAWESPWVRQLLVAKDVNLASVPRADAFVALYPYLSRPDTQLDPRRRRAAEPGYSGRQPASDPHSGPGRCLGLLQGQRCAVAGGGDRPTVAVVDPGLLRALEPAQHDVQHLRQNRAKTGRAALVE